MTLAEALELVRAGRLAEAAAVPLAGSARLRLGLAIAHAQGDDARALELAAQLWHVCEIDPTVLAVLVRHDHPELGAAAADLLMRTTSDAAYDVTPAWATLAAQPGDLDAWRDVLSSLIATGREVEAVEGVARALGDRHADFALWTLLTTILLGHRRRAGLCAAIELGQRAFPHAAEARAASAMLWLGLGDHARAAEQLAQVGHRTSDHPLVIAAHGAMAAAPRA